MENLSFSLQKCKLNLTLNVLNPCEPPNYIISLVRKMKIYCDLWPDRHHYLPAVRFCLYSLPNKTEFLKDSKKIFMRSYIEKDKLNLRKG